LNQSKTTKEFRLESSYAPSGDQPQAIENLVRSLNLEKNKYQTLLGVTGSGKTFTIANVLNQIQKPALVIAPNKTLAAQLFNEFKEFFPQNSIEFFISYYDYYRPESYIPSSDTFIEKTSKINQEIDLLRHSATKAIFEEKDVIVVASVSAIYGLGAPDSYFESAFELVTGLSIERDDLVKRLLEIYFERNDYEFERGTFRVKGECLEVSPTYQEELIRIEFWGDEIEKIALLDPVTRKNLKVVKQIIIYPAKHYVANQNEIERSCQEIKEQLKKQVKFFKEQNKNLEAERIWQRTSYDLEMLKEAGYCNGIENYSSILEKRRVGEPPATLVDYFNRKFNQDWICVIDESHISVPQLGAMYKGDRSRKQTLVDFGFRLPCALDNRPLKVEEFWELSGEILFVSATPGKFERENSSQVIKQIIRPTGLIDPKIEIAKTENFLEDLLSRIKQQLEQKQRTLITTLTKKNAENLSDYFQELKLKSCWLHSDLDAIDRVEILRDLRQGKYDILIGVNLLREGLDLPEVSLVAILDADKEGYLRSSSSLIQTIGRAARNSCGKVILYADKITDAIQETLDTNRDYREKQTKFNEIHKITPKTIIKDNQKNILIDSLRSNQNKKNEETIIQELESQDLEISEIAKAIKNLEKKMQKAAKELDFEQATELRNKLFKLREFEKKKLSKKQKN